MPEEKLLGIDQHPPGDPRPLLLLVLSLNSRCLRTAAAISVALGLAGDGDPVEPSLVISSGDLLLLAELGHPASCRPGACH